MEGVDNSVLVLVLLVLFKICCNSLVLFSIAIFARIESLSSMLMFFTFLFVECGVFLSWLVLGLGCCFKNDCAEMSGGFFL